MHEYDIDEDLTEAAWHIQKALDHIRHIPGAITAWTKLDQASIAICNLQQARDDSAQEPPHPPCEDAG